MLFVNFSKSIAKNKTLYNLLGIPKNAGNEQVNKACDEFLELIDTPEFIEKQLPWT